MLEETASIAPDGQPFNVVTLRNTSGMEVTILDWGATLLSCRVPMKDASLRETMLGCSSIADYLQQDAFLGATVGRYANRIANSQLRFANEIIHLSTMNPPHQLHGGAEGFDKRRWSQITCNNHEVIYRLISREGDQGFPGTLQATARFVVEEDNCLRIEYRAIVDKPCPVNLTQHAYFNLDSEQGDVRQHRLQLLADAYLPVDTQGIPNSALKPVTGTHFDFLTAKPIARDFLQDADQQAVKGYDHSFLLRAKGKLNQVAARVWSGDNLLQMSVYTTAPALQFYSGNYLAGTPARGKKQYQDYNGLALESGFLPDSPNHPEWPQPDCWLQPGEEYLSITQYQFQSL